MNDIALAEHFLVLLAHFIQQTETVSMGHICRRKPLPLIQIEDCGIRIHLFMKSQTMRNSLCQKPHKYWVF